MRRETHVTVIRGGDIVAYADGGHRLLRESVRVFEDDRVISVRGMCGWTHRLALLDGR
jgi:hypothetical protein